MTIINVDRRTLVVLLSTDENSECNDCCCFCFCYSNLTVILCLVDGNQPLDSLTTLNENFECNDCYCFCSSNPTNSLPCLRRKDLFVRTTFCFCFVLIVRSLLCLNTNSFYVGLVTSHSRLTFHGRIYLFVRITSDIILILRNLRSERIIHGRADIILTLSLVEAYKESRQKRLIVKHLSLIHI